MGLTKGSLLPAADARDVLAGAGAVVPGFAVITGFLSAGLAFFLSVVTTGAGFFFVSIFFASVFFVSVFLVSAATGFFGSVLVVTVFCFVVTVSVVTVFFAPSAGTVFTSV